MRKIDQWMIDTIKLQQEYFDKNSFASHRLEKSNANTRVTTGKRFDGKIVTTVYLHDNMIAQGDAETGWGFKMCGWPTPTTKARINAIAKTFGRDGVYTKNGKHYSGQIEVNDYDWF